MSSLTPSERSLRAKKAAADRWKQPGAKEAHGAKIRESRLRYHANLIDPDHKLDPIERTQLARQSLKAEMLGLAFRSAKARRQRKAS